MMIKTKINHKNSQFIVIHWKALKKRQRAKRNLVIKELYRIYLQQIIYQLKVYLTVTRLCNCKIKDSEAMTSAQGFWKLNI